MPALWTPDQGLFPPLPDEIDWSEPIDWQAPSAEGLVGLYSGFADPGSTVLRDLSYLRQDLALLGGPTWQLDSEFGGTLALVSASSQYAEFDATPVTAPPFTLACWFRSGSAALGQTLLWVGDKDQALSFWQLEARGDVAGDPVRAAAVSGSLAVAATTTGYSVNTWHHAAAVFASATDRRAFIDGGGKGTDTTSRAPTGSDRISLGRSGDSSPSSYLEGRIAEARLYNRALSDAEVLALYDPATRWEVYRRVQRRRVFSLPAGGNHYTLTADPGAVSVSGTAASLRVGRLLTGAAGAYTVSGTAAGLYRGYPLSAGAGAFSVSGTAAGLRASRNLAAAAGAYSVSGTAAGIRASRLLTSAAGAYLIAGTDAGLLYSGAGYVLTAESGEVALAGTAAALQAGRLVAAAGGTYSVSGSAADLRASRILAAGAGAYLVTGTAALLTVSSGEPGTLIVVTIGAAQGDGTQFGASDDGTTFRARGDRTRFGAGGA